MGSKTLYARLLKGLKEMCSRWKPSAAKMPMRCSDYLDELPAAKDEARKKALIKELRAIQRQQDVLWRRAVAVTAAIERMAVKVGWNAAALDRTHGPTPTRKLETHGGTNITEHAAAGCLRCQARLRELAE